LAIHTYKAPLYHPAIRAGVYEKELSMNQVITEKVKHRDMERLFYLEL